MRKPSKLAVRTMAPDKSVGQTQTVAVPKPNGYFRVGTQKEQWEQ
jgi:hypothetical protein